MATTLILKTEDPQILEQMSRIALATGRILHHNENTIPEHDALVFIGADMSDYAARRSRSTAHFAVGLDEGGEDLWKVAEQVNAEHVVLLPSGGRWLIELLMTKERKQEGVGIGVIGGNGGLGASTLACLIALAAQDRLNSTAGTDSTAAHTILIQNDPLGGCVDVLLGAEQISGARWQDLSKVDGTVSGQRLIAALPELPVNHGHGLRVLSAGISGGNHSGGTANADAFAQLKQRQDALHPVLDALRHGARMCVYDLGRWLEPGLSGIPWCDHLILLVRPDVPGLLAARILRNFFTHVPLSVLVCGPIPEGLSKRDISEHVGAEVLGTWPELPGLRKNDQLSNVLTKRSVRAVLNRVLAVVS